VKLSKRILGSGYVRAAACLMAALTIRLIHLSVRWQTIDRAIPAEFWSENRPFILAFWHGRLMMMPYSWHPQKAVKMLISDHQDGQLIARTIAHFGIDTVVGSSSKGGARALREMVRHLRQGTCVGITPDGPRGPRMRASEGVITLARLSGIPVIPVSYSVSRGRNLGSWDRFLLALPFGRGVFIWGDPIYVDHDSPESARQKVEDALNRITREADQHMGRVAVQPASTGTAGS